tara:strand:- start:609 stop:1067 length:459 start_codon:yes stop_codon:yes gene_type:complete
MKYKSKFWPINKIYNHLISKSIFRDPIPDAYKEANVRAPMQDERPVRTMISAEDIDRLRKISSEYDHDLPKVLKSSNLVRTDLEYCNESLALFMVLSQAYVGSYPQYAIRYWSVFTSTCDGMQNINIELVQAIHAAIGGTMVDLLNEGIKQH